jgi:transcriptional regulator with XRE-family HTH domain
VRQSADVMPMRRPSSTFSGALRTARTARGLPQEAFDRVSSRNYVSCLERGLKQPTITKVDELSAVLNLHPLSLLTLAYLGGAHRSDLASLLDQVRTEVLALLDAQRDQQAASTLPANTLLVETGLK